MRNVNLKLVKSKTSRSLDCNISSPDRILYRLGSGTILGNISHCGVPVSGSAIEHTTLRMFSRLPKVICLVALLLAMFTEYASGQDELHIYSVSGRVVDNDGRPVAFAQVTFLPKPLVMRKSTSPDLLISIITADQNGVFQSEERTPEQVIDQILYIAPPTPPKTYAPISFPFNYESKSGRPVWGYPVKRIRDQKLDVGDKVLPFQYGVVYMKLVNNNGDPLFNDTQDWEGIGLRITDSKGIRIAEHFLPRQVVKEAVELSESRIALSLPEGSRHIEVAPDGDAGKWFKSSRLIVTASKSPLEVTLRVAVR